MPVSAICPECRKKFPWNVALGYPKSCPICKFSIGHNVPDNVVVMPAIRTSKTSATDALYREMEHSSERRAEAAAEMAGTSVEDMAGLKITDLNSATREGDVAAVPVVNDVTRMMEAAPQATGFNSGAGLQFSQGSAVGPHASAGARMRTALHNHHSNFTGGAATSDTPALETQQPGYRRRG